MTRRTLHLRNPKGCCGQDAIEGCDAGWLIRALIDLPYHSGGQRESPSSAWDPKESSLLLINLELGLRVRAGCVG